MLKKTAALITVMVMALALAVSGLPTASVSADSSETYTVNFKGNKLPSNVEAIIAEAGGEVLQSNETLNYVRASSSNPNFLKQIRSNKAVADAGRELLIEQEALAAEQAFDGTDHPLYEEYQWDIKQVTQDGASYNLPKGKGTKDVVVAVIDTGIDLNHPDLKANIVDAKSFVPGETAIDYDGHGTHVAGSIAANGNVLGVGPELGIAGLKVFPREGGAPTAWIVEAIRYAADQDYDVINMSLGSYQYLQNPDYSTSDIVANINLFRKAIAYAEQKGVTVVGSAGNNGMDIKSPGQMTKYLFDENGATKRNPASNLLIRVSAGNKGKELAFYSNYGVGMIDVMAPGGDLGPNYNPETGEGRDNTYLSLSTVPTFDENGNPVGHGYGWKAGTSMAAPKVAGVAGVIIAKHGKNKLKPAQVKAIIKQSSEDVYKKGYDAYSGHGLVNAWSALQHK